VDIFISRLILNLLPASVSEAYPPPKKLINDNHSFQSVTNVCEGTNRLRAIIRAIYLQVKLVKTSTLEKQNAKYPK